MPTIRFYLRTTAALNGAITPPAGCLSLSEAAPTVVDASALGGGHISTSTGASACQLNKPTTKDNTTVAGTTPPTTNPPNSLHQFGWFTDKPYNGTIDAGTWTFRWRKDDPQAGITGNAAINLYASRTRDFGGMMRFLTALNVATDWWTGATDTNSWTTGSVGPFTLQNEFLFLQMWCVETLGFVSAQTMTVHQEGSDLVDATRSNLLAPNFSPACYPSDQMAFGKGYGLG